MHGPSVSKKGALLAVDVNGGMAPSNELYHQTDPSWTEFVLMHDSFQDILANPVVCIFEA